MLRKQLTAAVRHESVPVVQVNGKSVTPPTGEVEDPKDLFDVQVCIYSQYLIARSVSQTACLDVNHPWKQKHPKPTKDQRAVS